MNSDVNGAASRPRPLSGGLWTLLSWLRRDERNSSSESLSSAGSDRTAASFAFLTPAHYSGSNTTNVLPTIGPPTDSYKKRVHERNVRRQYERDLTLHRKYGLYRSEGGTGYDTFTLQQYRRTDTDSIGKWGRERRATSECLQRRPVHVPGKRRAPLPPLYPISSSKSATLDRRKRKRPAPQPPAKTEQNPITKLDDNSSVMNPKINCNDQSMPAYVTSVDCKSEKYVKKDSNRKDKKSRSETSFLKQIFENRKRNSTNDTASIKILPSISELDKQAAEIIKNEKLKASEKNFRNSDLEFSNLDAKEYWFCTKCLKKYNSFIKECYYCFPESKENTTRPIRDKTHLKNEICTQTDNGLTNPTTSGNNKFDDKQKLKEILKEMKDSLPKKSKRESDRTSKLINNTLSENKTKRCSVVSETPTLRIGCSLEKKEKQIESSGVQSQIVQSKSSKIKPIELNESPVLTNVVESVEEHSKATEILLKLEPNMETYDKDIKKVNNNSKSVPSNQISNCSGKKDLHTPLRISSLLNPVYIPKINAPIKKTINNKLPVASTSVTIKTILTNKSVSEEPLTVIQQGVSYTPTQGSELTAQIQSLKTDCPKPTIKINESPITIKDETKGNNLNRELNPKITILPNNVVPLILEEASKQKSSDFYGHEKKIIDPSPTTSSSTSSSANSNAPVLLSNLEKVNQHARRRELVNQLEKSIAKGDEQAAADAAVKLAQLRLSCSVLSFSSQIVTEPLPSTSFNEPGNKNITTQISQGSVINSISPFKNENTSSAVQLPIINTKKSTVQLFQTSTNKPINGVKLEQNYKQKIPTSTEQNEFSNGKIVVKKEDAISQKKPYEEMDNKHNVSIQVWIEDKEAARGPINLNTQRNALMGELRIQAEDALGLPTRLQRWIVGRTLCTDDNIPIATLAGPEFNAPFYLCLVEPGQSDGHNQNTTRTQVGEKQNGDTATAQKIGKTPNKVEATEQKMTKTLGQESTKAVDQDAVKTVVQNTVNIMMQNGNQAANVYKELVKLEQQALVPNADSFECGVCMDECPPNQGVILRECVHMFCRDCLTDLVRHCEDPGVLCPAMGCRSALQEREIRALVTAEDYERWLARGLAAAESGTRNAFHCRTRDCNGWALCDPGVLKFPCPVCKHTNCVPCQAIHEGETCDSYRNKLQSVTNVGLDQIDGSTRALIDTLIKKGEALECPECKAIITKKWGCDWVKCSACKTEICWVTRGRRWGPAGRGDTSSGCRCGIDGKKCHPSCGYCH